MTQPESNSKSVSPAGLDIRYDPLPGSRKIYKAGQIHPDIRVPFREISLSPTVEAGSGRTIPNLPVEFYDTSGIYTQEGADIDISRGLPPLRRDWILRRGDVSELPKSSSAYRQSRGNRLLDRSDPISQ